MSNFYGGRIEVGDQFFAPPFRFTVVANGDDVRGTEGQNVWFVSELSLSGTLRLVVMTEEFLRHLALERP